MPLSFRKTLLRLLAACALLGFAGDLAADAYADWRGDHCAAEASHSSPSQEKSPCSHCSCATHTGAAILANFATGIGKANDLIAQLSTDDGVRPVRRSASIDHPPQLA